MKLESLEMKATLSLKIPKTSYNARSAASAKTRILEFEAVKTSTLASYFVLDVYGGRGRNLCFMNVGINETT